MSITSDDLKGMIRAITAAIESEKDALNTLDAALGDGDHGTGISMGFASVVDATTEAENPSDVLRLAAMTLMNRMGGSSGALYGTLFLKAAMHIKDKARITPDDFVAMWQKGCEGVAQRGKSQLGDKTMLDALSPAVDTLAQQISTGIPFVNALNDAATAAEFGAESTEKMQAKHGRAKFVGERAIGHRDAGAQSIALMFRAISNYWKDK
ncbi:MAG: dihydroxyacetone kinase subunit DhaL [Anaerolineae bacterium]|nr:dihydroxyacetone kinase subunit DhaL [Anaerolineae bacterium]